MLIMLYVFHFNDHFWIDVQKHFCIEFLFLIHIKMASSSQMSFYSYTDGHFVHLSL